MASYIVPDYYDRFRCKCGDCRKSCCSGWNITMSMQEYYALLSADGSDDLRRRLSGALEIISDDRERYAAFVHTQSGRCPLLADNGLCMLQRECGEGPMPGVCRVYPRAIRNDFACEVALSSSCEAVCELLLGDIAPLTFVRRDLPLDPAPARAHDQQTTHFLNNLRITCGRVLEDRTLPLADRIAHLHALLRELHRIEQGSGIRELYLEAENLNKRPFPLLRVPEADWIHLAAPLAIAGAFIPESPSLSRYWDMILAALHLPADRAEWSEEYFIRAERRYALLKGRFSDMHPHWQKQFERLMVNYAFYTRLPFSDRLSGLEDEALALAACYALLRFVAVTCTTQQESPFALADAVSAVMRLVEHSGFDRRCVALLRRGRFDDEEHLSDMLLVV